MADQDSKPAKGLLERFAPLLLIAVVAMAFVIGALWQKVQLLQKNLITDLISNSTPQPNIAGATAVPQAVPTSGKLASDQAAKLPKVTQADHLRGSLNAPVILIEYSDYYCPFCSRFHVTAKQVLSDYGDQIAWVYRHFPLDQLHPHARALAELSECVTELAGDDAFWLFTDATYESVPADPAAAINLAVSQGINKDSLQKCYDDGQFKSKVEDQYQTGLAAGVTGTPGNFIVNQAGDTWKLPGAVPLENLKTVIDEALGK